MKEGLLMAVRLLDLEPQRRDAFLNAALKEFSIKGFDRASTNVISKDAGISKALMFHYISSKEELFLFVYDYFSEMLEKEYFKKVDYSQKDIFERLRQSYYLQIKLIKEYPWIYEIAKISTSTNSEKVNNELEKRIQKKQAVCCNQAFDTLFDMIDESKFQSGLDIKKCKKIIYWCYAGFTNDILNDIRNSKATEFDYELIMKKLDGYLEELRKIFYK